MKKLQAPLKALGVFFLVAALLMTGGCGGNNGSDLSNWNYGSSGDEQAAQSCSISGTLRDISTSLPIRGATCTLGQAKSGGLLKGFLRESGRSIDTGTTTTDRSGSYTFSGIPPGDYHIRFSHDSYISSVWRSVAVKDSVTVKDHHMVRRSFWNNFAGSDHSHDQGKSHLIVEVQSSSPGESHPGIKAAVSPSDGVLIGYFTDSRYPSIDWSATETNKNGRILLFNLTRGTSYTLTLSGSQRSTPLSIAHTSTSGDAVEHYKVAPQEITPSPMPTHTSTSTPTPSPTVSGTHIDILADQPVYAMHEGYGANVTSMNTSIEIEVFEKWGGRVGSAYCALPEPDDEAHWSSIFSFMNWSGLDWIRLNMEMNDYEPGKDHFTWDSGNFRRLLKILDWAQAHDVDVLLQQQDQATQWNFIQMINPAFSAPSDMNAFANGFATMVDYLVNTKNYTCIKLLNITNEPMNWWGWWAGGCDISVGYQMARSALDAKGIKVPLCGTEYFDSGGYTYNWDACKAYLGAFENHCYGSGAYDSPAYRPISDPDYPVLWGEFGGGDNTGYDWNIFVAKWYLGGPANGIDGFARWSYLNQNDIDGIFSFIQTYDTVNKKLLDTYTPTENLYWIDGIVSRFTSKYSTAHAVACDDQDFMATFLKSPDGAYTLIVVNGETSGYGTECSYTFQGLEESKTLYRYSVTPPEVKDRTGGVTISSSGSFTVGPASPSFNDMVSSNSIFVYSTYNLPHEANGIVDDGPFAPISTRYPISYNTEVWGSGNANITYQGAWATAADPRSYGKVERYTSAPGAFYQFSFTGTNFRLYGHQDNGSCLATVYIDGQRAGYANSYAPVTLYQMMTYNSPALKNGTHTVKVVFEGKSTVTAGGAYINLDAIGFKQAP
ncbi:MAG: carboxypeptidase-like regulatory domain-containing protein [Candidatus Eremiobacteraeota bacterium]|nr:carboxypeptidase-like regulatory domain-containing protein [Candidatus Eremiobacteraeota bacterium]